MHNQQLTDRLEAAKIIAKQAGAFLLESRQGNLGITEKGTNDFVTVVDVASERMIKAYLHDRFPKDNFLGEEMGYESYGDGGTWIIDPIDGTTNYIHGLPGFSISIAYEQSQWDPVVGVVFDPITDELYSAQRGTGAYCNDVPIAVSRIEKPHDTVIMISPPLRFRYRLPAYMKVYQAVCADSGETRDYGSAALHLCYIAHGRGEAFIEFGLGYHDIAAGTVILKEAGGNISQLDLPHAKPFTSSLIATNEVMHTYFVNQVQIR
jgi:myo-inositol-1(or 4)-monophosphatase